MHKIVFYPVGNGDTCQIILSNKKRILFDYCHRAAGEDDEEPLIDLKKQLRDELKAEKRDYIDVVGLSHGDDDHICGSTDFFELQHSSAHQGGDRIKARELWVPAGLILQEGTTDNQDSDLILWRQEARYRLKRGEGIRVFSKPDRLKDWLAANGLTVESRRHLLVDAGQLAPGFSLPVDGVEFFVHAPFIKHTPEGDIARNECSLIFQVRFEVGGVQTDFLQCGDTIYEVLEDMVAATKAHGNDHRLNWHLFNIPHHCSYLALGPEKGKRETEPTDKVKELLRHGQRDAYIVSSSWPILDDADAYEQIQPPHVQARNAYETYLAEVGGRKFLVTMSEPNGFYPEPIEFEVDHRGLRRVQKVRQGAAAVVAAAAPRAG